MPTLSELLTAQAARLGAGAVTGADRLALMRELEDVKAAAAAAQAELAVAFEAGVREERAAQGVPARSQGTGIAAELALARRESPHAGLRHLGLAQALVRHLPCAMAALKAGVVTEPRVMAAARVIAALAPEDWARADRELFADQATCATWGNSRIEAEARKVAYRLDPVGFTERCAKAEEERRVGLRPAPDTMSWFSALLSVKYGIAVKVSLERLADAALAGSGPAGDQRTRGQLMADGLVEKVTGLDLGVSSRASSRPDPTSWGPRGAADSRPPEPTEEPPAPMTTQEPPVPTTEEAATDPGTSPPVTVNLTMSDQTLLAGGPDPAWVDGYGPIPAQLARDWVARAEWESRATLRRLYVSPSSGALVAMESRSRIFPRGLARFIALRDQTCRTPWCDAPVRQTDHVTASASGGPTTGPNGQGLCVRCNLAKEGRGWETWSGQAPGQRHQVHLRPPHAPATTSSAPDLPRPSQQPAPKPGPAEPWPVHRLSVGAWARLLSGPEGAQAAAVRSRPGARPSSARGTP